MRYELSRKKRGNDGEDQKSVVAFKVFGNSRTDPILPNLVNPCGRLVLDTSTPRLHCRVADNFQCRPLAISHREIRRGTHLPPPSCRDSRPALHTRVLPEIAPRNKSMLRVSPSSFRLTRIRSGLSSRQAKLARQLYP